jgi:hypothetical protein
MRTIPGSALQATAVLILVVVGGGLGAPVPPDEYVFVPYRPLIALMRDGAYDFGRFDERGNFVAEKRVHVKDLDREIGWRVAYAIWYVPKPNEVYEFRSERLIKGTLEKDFNFVPHVGATVIHFKDYKYSPDAIRIWNLPGYFEKKPPPKPQGEAK